MAFSGRDLQSGMQIDKLFELKEEIQKDEFVKKWEDSERERDEANLPDSSARKRLEQHRNLQGLKYYVVTLTQNGIDNLILPYHVHPDNKVNQGGEPFREVISKYLKLIQGGRSDECLQRLYWIKHNRIKLNEAENFIEGKFMFVSDDRELAIPEYYRDHGKNKLYTGNFHQFVAYGLIVADRYTPIKVYYCVKEEVA